MIPVGTWDWGNPESLGSFSFCGEVEDNEVHLPGDSGGGQRL